LSAYYNEVDRYAAQWLRNLIAAGHIAPGDVDERSIVDVRADDLKGYTQAHFFAGIGGWSLALRLAGWPDDRPVWTGSCPCQPFLAAGAGKAADDERHLWPAWFPLIRELAPAIVFGEQVEAAIGWGWLDAVFADLEEQGYACGATVLPACGVGAPHIRQRCWFVADAHRERTRRGTGTNLGAACAAESAGGGHRHINDVERAGKNGDVANSDSSRQRPRRPSKASDGINTPRVQPTGLRASEFLAHTERNGGRSDEPWRQAHRRKANGWSDASWLECTDGKARPVEPGTFPLAHGIPGRVGRLRAYGNAIVAPLAAEFIAASMDAIS